MSWRQARSSLRKVSHRSAENPKFYAARENVTGVQVSLVAATGVHVSGVLAMGSHFSTADVASVNAIVDVELPSNMRLTDADMERLGVNAAAPVTLNTALAVVERLGVIAAAAFLVPSVATDIVDTKLIVAVACSILSFRP
jgi:hypothetical protein|tara:strand:+ start:303 stop:725 length:423 start_codon:yes stop_codon:yes gene_type:complete